MKKITTRQIAITGILGGLCIVLALTPIGYIPVGPTKATIMHIPVIIAAILEGPVIGAIVGLIFGLSSILNAIIAPTPVAFTFFNPMVSVVPRILIGVFSYYVYSFFKRTKKPVALTLLTLIWIAVVGYLSYNIVTTVKEGNILNISFNVALLLISLVGAVYSYNKFRKGSFEIVASSIVGTLTNTVLVLFFIYIFYAQDFVSALDMDPKLAGKIITGIGISNGIPEVIAAVVIVTAVVTALKRNKE